YCHCDRRHLLSFPTRRSSDLFKGIPHFKEHRLKMVTSDGAEEVFAAFDRELEEFGDFQFAWDSINFLFILLLAILDEMVPRIMMVVMTTKRFTILNSTG